MRDSLPHIDINVATSVLLWVTSNYSITDNHQGVSPISDGGDVNSIQLYVITFCRATDDCFSAGSLGSPLSRENHERYNYVKYC